MTDVPSPLKAIVGLVAAAVDRLPEARELPEKAVELPVLAVSAFLQASLRAQQVYAELSARGDEAISQLRGAPEQPPAWARFDDAPTQAPDSESAAPSHAAPEGGTTTGESAGTTSPATATEVPEVPEDFEADMTDDETQIPLDDSEFPGPPQEQAQEPAQTPQRPAPYESARHESGLADGRGPSAFDLAED